MVKAGIWKLRWIRRGLRKEDVKHTSPDCKENKK
jgi:hypothetical protein